MSEIPAPTVSAPTEGVALVGRRELNVAIFADGANYDDIIDLASDPLIKGFTTNPTLMRAAGISDYTSFAHRVLEQVTEHPISFEVFADEFDQMEKQALRIASWGENVYVKIPITDTKGRSSCELVRRLANQGVQLNVTALMTSEQVREASEALAEGPSSFVSVFAGRIADTGRDPLPIMRDALQIMRPYPKLKLIWASPREVLNAVQAGSIGCHVITMTRDLLKKIALFDKDLTDYSLDTVKMFFADAAAAAYEV